jgi:hypothetical protein
MRRDLLLLAGFLLADGGGGPVRSALALRELRTDADCQRMARALNLDPAAPVGTPGTRAFGIAHRSGGGDLPAGTSVSLKSEMGSEVETTLDGRGTFFVTVDGKTARLRVAAPGFEPAVRELTAGTYCIEASLAPAGQAR